MPDWTGSRARADALAIPCVYCHAPAGQPCVNQTMPDHPPLTHFAAHQKRIDDATCATVIDAAAEATEDHDEEVPF